MRTFLVLHGLENHRWPDHWQRHLVTSLRSAGHCVVYPQLPNPEEPVQEQWHEVVRTEFELLRESGVADVTVIAHSLSGLSMLALLEHYQPPLRIEHLLLVAPADPELIAQRTNFRLEPSSPAVREGLARSAASVTLLASDADEWLPHGIHATYAEPLGVAPVIFEGAGHISMTDGFGKWHGVLAWAQAPESSERSSLLVHR